jgi:hypothetical protein
MAAFLSDEITVAEDTVYPAPSRRGILPLAFDRRTAGGSDEAHGGSGDGRGAGRYLVGIPDFQVAIDIVSCSAGRNISVWICWSTAAVTATQYIPRCGVPPLLR